MEGLELGIHIERLTFLPRPWTIIEFIDDAEWQTTARRHLDGLGMIRWLDMAKPSAHSLVAALLVACGPEAPGAGSEGAAATTGASHDSSGRPVTTGVSRGSSGESSDATSTSASGGVSGEGTHATSTSGGVSGGGVGGGMTADASGMADPSTTGEHASTGDSGTTTDGADCGSPSWDQDCPPVDCNKYVCGTLFSRYDEQGLRRKSCNSTACCGPGFECFRPYDWGGCVPSVWGCNSATEDCGGSYCVPKELGPPPYACGGTDEASCLAAGCTFVMAPYFYKSDTCDCGPPMPLCLWFPEAGPSVEKPTAYYPDSGNDPRLLPMEWSAPPFSWQPCAGDPDAPLSCSCADECAP